jgi:NSS family neurotransmitter:Na+ symporter
VLFYLLFLVIMGAPVLAMELSVGRAGQGSAMVAYRNLEPEGSKWHIHGIFCMLGCYLLMMYYTTVSGWILSYFFKFATGTFEGLNPEEIGGVFGSLLGSAPEMTLWMAITVLLGLGVVSLGLKNGLERVTKVMMTALLALILMLAVNSLTLKGAGEGLRFYLLPNWKRASEVGIGNVIMAAMNQSFFTLSLGIGSMEIFGSYMSKDKSIWGEAFTICGLDTFVALMSGFIIFPACFSFGVSPAQGPALIFVTLPNVFVNMTGGRIWGTLFFLFMTFASFSTVIAVFENIIAYGIDVFHWSRSKAVVINGVFLLLASMPCVLGYNVLSGFHPLPGKDILDTEDFIVSNLLLPTGALAYTMFCVSRWGWGYESFVTECNQGEGLRLRKGGGLKMYLQFGLPVLILIILVQGLLP